MRVTESPSDKYLDQTSLQYLVEKIKEEIKKNGGSSGENVDLSDYYTKSQIDDIVKQLPSGSTGVGISGVSINSAGHLIVSLTDGTSTDVGNVVGKDGVNGKDGVDGKNGIDGVNGALCKIGDTESFINKIFCLLDYCEDKMIEMRKNALKTIERLKPEYVTKQLVQYYEKMIVNHKNV